MPHLTMNAMKARYLRSIRLLAECFHAFERISSEHIRTLDLTPSQFDIIATLGNTPGMTFKELGDKTLITKGTLTGIVDRLEDKGLVRRVAQPEDRRSTIVKLTARGEREFERVFQPHVEHCRKAFGGMSDAQFDALDRELSRLKAALDQGAGAVRCTD